MCGRECAGVPEVSEVQDCSVGRDQLLMPVSAIPITLARAGVARGLLRLVRGRMGASACTPLAVTVRSSSAEEQ